METSEIINPKATPFKLVKALMDAGLSKKSADMVMLKPFYVENGDIIPKELERLYRTKHDYSIEEIDTFPAWSLGALINLLPKALYEDIEDIELAALGLNSEYELVLRKDYIAYITCDGEKTMYEFYGENLMECASKMIIQLLNNGWKEDTLTEAGADV